MLKGDLSRPLLGLTAPTWDDLARRIDSIYHVAGRVSLMLGYQALGVVTGFYIAQGQPPAAFAAQSVTFGQFTQHVGLPNIQALERRYGVTT